MCLKHGSGWLGSLCQVRPQITFFLSFLLTLYRASLSQGSAQAATTLLHTAGDEFLYNQNQYLECGFPFHFVVSVHSCFTEPSFQVAI